MNVCNAFGNKESTNINRKFSENSDKFSNLFVYDEHEHILILFMVYLQREKKSII